MIKRILSLFGYVMERKPGAILIRKREAQYHIHGNPTRKYGEHEAELGAGGNP